MQAMHSVSTLLVIEDCWFYFLVFLTNKHRRMARFEKKLTKTDEGSMLVIPTRFSRNHMPRVEGGHCENIRVVDVGGTEWTFGYYVRRHRNPRPVLRSGWRRYVLEKELKVGDRIIFERVDGFPELYRIGARRRITLFGQEVWTDVF